MMASETHELDRQAAALWRRAMLGGDFELAWRQSDAIRRRGAPDPHRFWQGEPLTGKRVMLRCLHGFGDAVQFLRYGPRLRSIAAHLIVEVPPRFVDLAHCFDGIDEVITWGNDAPPEAPKWDVQIEVMELPYLFRTQLAELPIATDYLRLPRIVARTSSTLLRVGIACTSGDWNPARSLPLAALEPILALSRCEFWSLEHHATGSPLRIDPEASRSVIGLACHIASLDLVVTVDTLAAHLAGALGIPAFVLLQHDADWRWMAARCDSPWYPSLRLFRQPRAGDWTSCVAALRDALEARVSRAA
jgi:hypothetical protein